jgi:endogenous inhibitor of DNA gyrase (YacG/DUF329 family)
MKIVCPNCQKVMRRESQLRCVFPDIPDLLQRISPGEEVPIGECPDCGALVHVVEKQSKKPKPKPNKPQKGVTPC